MWGLRGVDDFTYANEVFTVFTSFKMVCADLTLSGRDQCGRTCGTPTHMEPLEIFQPFELRECCARANWEVFFVFLE